MYDKKAFTLIELLVVISIISFLSSITLASLNTARAKGRDAFRIQSLKELQKAVELYYDKNGEYPRCNRDSNGNLTSNEWCSGCNNPTGFKNVLNVLVTDGYMKQIPTDPTESQAGGQCFTYEYVSRPGATTTDTGRFGCGGIEVGNYGYAFRFAVEKTTLNLPQFGYQRSPSIEYCIVGPHI